MTEIRRDGTLVAIALHSQASAGDPIGPDRSPVVSLAADNERLFASVRHEVLELRASKARIVEAGDTLAGATRSNPAPISRTASRELASVGHARLPSVIRRRSARQLMQLIVTVPPRAVGGTPRPARPAHHHHPAAEGQTVRIDQPLAEWAMVAHVEPASQRPHETAS